VIDTIVYVVDRRGTAYGVRDLTGAPLQVQRCSDDLTEDCRIDSCLPDGMCDGSGHCTNSPTEFCSSDTCEPTGVCGTVGRCSNDPVEACLPDNCVAYGAVCNSDTSECQCDQCAAAGFPCTPDTCMPDGTCQMVNGTLVADGPVDVAASPIT